MNKDRRKQIDTAANLLRECVDKVSEAKSLVETIATEERDYYDNMSENLQGGDKGEAASAAAELLEEIQQTLDEIDLDDLVGKLEEAKGG